MYPITLHEYLTKILLFTYFNNKMNFAGNDENELKPCCVYI